MCGSPRPRIFADGELPPWITILSEEAVEAFGAPPASFDGRTAWPHCAPIIGHVRNQGPCGDCWAFGGTQMMQDRFCIATGNNATSQLLSVEDVIACMDLFIGTPGQGCGGGDPINTYYYLSHEGIVSGGDYGDKSGDTCLPYLVPPTLSMVDEVPTPHCVGQNKTFNHPSCVSNYKTPNSTCDEACAYAADKRVAASTFTCPGGAKGVACIQAGLMTGSGATSMVVFGDIWSYKEGLYSCGNRTGGSGHAVVLVGWGTDANGTDYWTVKSKRA
jgi:cathepsin B